MSDRGPIHPAVRPDFLVVGGGIIGLSVALELRRRRANASVVVLEKEERAGRHASGRNSGVLHAGFYYTADSLKAKLTRLGNRRLTRYCRERGVPIDRCGKLVVARRDEDLPWLEELVRRGRANGVELHEVTAAEASEIEPRARTVERALYSPTTAAVDPRAVVEALVQEARAAGIAVRTSTAYVRRDGGTVVTNRGRCAPGYVVNAAGLYADRVARDFGFAEDYRILPFKGLYLESAEPAETLRTHVYPVPDLRYPFLGVHFTRAVDGRVKIGPTALPALWREHYRGLDNFRLGELARIGATEARLLATNAFGFRRLALRELPKISKRYLLARAAELVPDLAPASAWRWSAPGVRAQLFHTGRQELVMDFHLEGDDGSMHVLNAVSPAFTCALPFADLVVDEIETCLARGGPAARETEPTERPGAPCPTETAGAPGPAGKGSG